MAVSKGTGMDTDMDTAMDTAIDRVMDIGMDMGMDTSLNKGAFCTPPTANEATFQDKKAMKQLFRKKSR
jgi:hypothetical protein